MDTVSTNSKKILCLIGPTATGKTDLGLTLAEKFQGELVSCDSRQVYKGLDLGTGKEPGEQVPFSKHSGYWIVNGIKIWMYDIADFTEIYSVSNYIEDAGKVVRKLLHQNTFPIIVGGTGLYLEGLLKGSDTAFVAPNSELRNELENLDVLSLQQKLETVDKVTFDNLNNSEKNNPRRLIRKIEIALSGEREKKGGIDKWVSILKIGLFAPKEILHQRIERRVTKRVQEGMIAEAVSLHKAGLSYDRMKQLGLEYGVMADFLEGTIKSEEEFILVLQQKIEQYAKRQMTWFKRDKDIVWFDISDKDYREKVEKLVQDWYNTSVSGVTSQVSRK